MKSVAMACTDARGAEVPSIPGARAVLDAASDGLA